MTRTVFHAFFFLNSATCIFYTYLTFIDSKVLFTSQTYILSNDPVNLELFLPGFYLRNTTSLRKKEKMAMLPLRIKVCMNIIFSLRYLFIFSYSKNNSKFTGSLNYRELVTIENR
jgi:hypothetical protein